MEEGMDLAFFAHTFGHLVAYQIHISSCPRSCKSHIVETDSSQIPSGLLLNNRNLRSLNLHFWSHLRYLNHKAIKLVLSHDSFQIGNKKIAFFMIDLHCCNTLSNVFHSLIEYLVDFQILIALLITGAPAWLASSSSEKVMSWKGFSCSLVITWSACNCKKPAAQG